MKIKRFLGSTSFAFCVSATFLAIVYGSIFRFKSSILSTPIQSGDLSGFYFIQDLIWNKGEKANWSFAFPNNYDLHAFLYTDVFLSFLVKVFLNFTPNIFLACNLVFLVSVFLNFCFTYAIGRAVDLKKTSATFCGLVFITLPWSIGRLEHPAEWVPSVCLLPLLVYSKKVTRTFKTSLFWGIVIGLFISIQGPYFFVFTAIISAILLFTSWLAKHRQNPAHRVFLFSILVFSSIGFLASLSYISDSSIKSLSTSYPNDTFDSLRYGGYLLTLLMPLSVPDLSLFKPINDKLITQIVTQEPTWLSNRTSIMFLAMLFFILVWSLKRKSASALIGTESEDRKLLSLYAILVLLTLLFVKGGLGPLFSMSILGPIRAWNRLFPTITLLIILIFMIKFESHSENYRQKKRLAFYGLAFSLFFLQIASLVEQPWLKAFSGFKEGQTMVTKMESNLKAGCAILQIPEIPHDGSGGKGRMSTYDHYIPIIFSKNLKWTYGNSPSDFKRYLITYSPIELAALRKSGFCAIEIDKYGATPTEIITLQKIGKKIIHSGTRYIVIKI